MADTDRIVDETPLCPDCKIRMDLKFDSGFTRDYICPRCGQKKEENG